MRIYIRYLFLLPLLLTTACTDLQPEASNPEARLNQERRAYRADLKTDLDAFHQELQAFEAQWQEAGEETQVGLQETRNGLRVQYDKLRQDLERLDGSDASVFDRQRNALTQRLYDLEINLKAARLEVIEPRMAFEEAAEARLDEMDRNLAALTQHVQGAPQTPTAVSDDVLAELQQQHDEVARQLEHLAGASEDTFRDLRTEMARAVARLDTEISRAMDHMARALGTPEPKDETAS